MSSITSQTPPNPRSGRPASIAPSISSVLSDATTVTTPVHQQRGFKSREAYLAALSEFAESKLYMPAGEHTLHGWYGSKTMDDYKKRPGLRDGKKKRRKSQAEESDDVNRARTTSMGLIPEAAEESADLTTAGETGNAASNTPNYDNTEKQGRLKRLSRVFTGGSSSSRGGDERSATVV